MNTNLNVNINGYKVLGNGEVRDKIEVFIVKNGISKGKFGKYSGGQKERVKLSAILTFFNLINNGLNGKGLNLLCLDESLDHLDELGQKKCLELLKLFDITTLVITHGHAETLLDGYEKVIVRYKDKEEPNLIKIIHKKPKRKLGLFYCLNIVKK
jgi:exonuclease SbcC